MDFADRTLVELTQDARRDAILDQTALGQLVSAAFDTSLTVLDGPYALHVESSELGLEIISPVTVEGAWSAPGSSPTDARFRLLGLRIGSTVRVDAVWRGSLIARTVPVESTIDDVRVSFVASDIDRDIVATLGALPVDPAALEAARRERLLARLRGAMQQPNVLGDAALDRMLTAAKVRTVGALLATRGASALGVLQLRFSAPAPGATPIPVSLPVTIAVLVRDQPLPVAALLAESRTIRAALAGDQPPPPPHAIRRRTPVPILWVVPDAVFDDIAWAGADRVARRASAGAMLATQGIGLAVRA